MRELLHRQCSLPAGTPALVWAHRGLKSRTSNTVYLPALGESTLVDFIFQVKHFIFFGK
jgi:hypothetical protein